MNSVKCPEPLPKPTTADDITGHFTRVHKPTIAELLETLVAVG